MLRNPIIRGVNLSQVNAIARLNQRIQQVEDTVAVLASEEAFHILEKECQRSRPRDEMRKDRH
jgi:hypothetical protein